ncbi:MAG: hypothetical protein GX638_12425 [Crenarchaeota archaeon]|nr:hypothetical protein [Thermoproteota archaeon]
MKTTIAVLNKRRENATTKIIDTLNKVKDKKEKYFGITTFSEKNTEKDPKKLARLNLNSSTIFGYVSSKPLFENNLEFINQEGYTGIIEGMIYSPTKPFDSLIKFSNEPKKMVVDFINQIEGDYSFIIIEKEKILATRDQLGIQPLYFGENSDFAAIASNRRVLWALGIKCEKTFPPGHIASVTDKGFEFELVKKMVQPKQKPYGIDEAARILQRLLEQSVKIRVVGLDNVAVAFSGGLDSSLVAFLAKKYCPNVQLIHVSLENQKETEDALKAAQALNLPLQVHLFKKKDVEATIPQVLRIIEEHTPLKVNVGIPLYWVAEKTMEAKYSVLLAGQGADELFGGYQRYVREYIKDGSEKVKLTMFNDLINICESNLERDKKICNYHDVQLRLPFASYEIVNFALSLPTDLMFENKMDSLRKLVLRKAAANLGIPKDVTLKPKKAIQYSTGISNVLQEIAKKQKTTQDSYLKEKFIAQLELFDGEN